MEDERPQYVCAVWTPDGAIDEDLLQALRHRGVDPIAAQGPHEAFARLLRATEAAETPPALLLIEPRRLRNPDRLLRAAERAVPRCALWAYERSEEGPRLAALAPGTPARGSGAGAAEEQGSENHPSANILLPGANRKVEPTPHGGGAAEDLQPSLRLARGERESEAAFHRDPIALDEERMDPPPAGSVLTEDELAMLLAEDEPEPRIAEEPKGR